jgi:hypothetical protein
MPIDRAALLSRIRDRLGEAPDGVLTDIATKLGIPQASVTEARKVEQHFNKFANG